MLFTKPARAGRVKTRLIGDLTAGQAAELHAAFLADLLARLDGGRFELWVAWALDPGEDDEDDEDDEDSETVPGPPPPATRALRQQGADLGERLHRALAEAARGGAAVAALGSDHPTLPVAVVERAFEAVEAGADAAIGPAEDGGYYLIALAPRAVRPELFAGIAWSTDRVLAATLERCRALGLAVELLPTASDVDTPADLARLAGAMAADGDLGCPAHPRPARFVGVFGVRVLSAEAMRAVDRAAIEELGLPGLVLMENAALGVADAIGESFPDAAVRGGLLRPRQQRRRRPRRGPPARRPRL